MQPRESLCVSLYAPMVKAGPETQQNPIRFKNLVRRASDALAERGLAPKDAEGFLAPAAALLEDTPFWQHQGQGLAAFVADGFFRWYRLPLEVRELSVVEDRFHLKPLLPLLSGDGRFYVLALAQKHVRLLEATRHSVREVDLGDLPTSLNDAKAEIQKFFNLLDQGIGTVVADKHAPLVLAGVEFLFPLYRQASDHPHLVDGGVPGNPAELSNEELHERAWPLVEPHFTRGQEEAEGRFRELLGTGQASAHLDDVVTAAHDGRVDTLFVALGTRRWGSFDELERRVELADHNGPGTEDLVDLAAIQTLLKGGTVYAVPPESVPEGAEVAAVYRY